MRFIKNPKTDKLIAKGDEDYKEPHRLIDEARDLLDQRRFAEAINNLKEVLDIIPDDEEAISLIAEAYASLDDKNNADKYRRLLHEINPENPEFFIMEAQQAVLRQDFKQGLENVDRALKLCPDYFDAIIMKAQLLYWQDNKDYKKFISLARQIDKKRTDRFMKEFWIEGIPESHPSVQVSKGLEEANLLLIKGQFDKAYDILMHIKKIETNKDLLVMIEGIAIECLIAMKKTREALDAIQNLLLLDSENPHAYLYKAKTEFDAGKIEQSLNTINTCIEYAEKRNIPHFDYYSAKAHILKALGKDYKIWEEKGEKLRLQSLNKLKQDAKKYGIQLEEKNGFLITK